jgi:outer membrane protein
LTGFTCSILIGLAVFALRLHSADVPTVRVSGTIQAVQAIHGIELADASIGAAARTRDLAQKNVEAEQHKYELGTITAFEVLDSQTRLASSESALLNAYVSYQEAYINYQRATWSLLDGLGMVIETPKVR